MSPEEWKARETIAMTSTNRKLDYQIILEWKDLINSLDITPYLGPMRNRTFGPHRIGLYKKLSEFKRFPENVLSMIDSLAEGHARLNRRNSVLPEDYEAIDKLFSRFLVLADMKKKELYIAEEIIRSEQCILTEEGLIYKLRRRSKKEDLPEFSEIKKTIYNYATSSKYICKDIRACRGKQPGIVLSSYLKDIFTKWNEEIKELVQ
jgi:hypothetical protein